MASPVGFAFKNITLSSGDRVELQNYGLHVLIGPNNSGKSTILRELFSSMGAGAFVGRALRNVEIDRTGDVTEVQAWLAQNFPVVHPQGVPNYATRGALVRKGEVGRAWDDPGRQHLLRPFLVTLLGTEDRLTLAKYGASIDRQNAAPERYIHVLQSNDALDSEVRSHIRSAFGVDLIINHGGGSQVGFHVGKDPDRVAGVDRVSQSYLNALTALPRLDDEGDGLKSYVSTILAAFCGPQLVLLLDEPEAFLHPPQARRLASALAVAAANQRRQSVIATHSSDIVAGAVSSGVPVTITRITRTGETNHAATIDQQSLRELWSKPLLRSASAIDSMFHEGVVLCEGDADCRFYEAAIRRVEEQGQTTRSVDLYFAHGNGKGALPSLLKAYRSLGVPCVVIADIDLLRDLKQLRTMVDLSSTDPTTAMSLASLVQPQLRRAGPALDAEDLVSRLREAADAVTNAGELSPDDRRALARALENSADWSQAKRFGVEVLKGGARQTADKLLAELSTVGIFLVPVGELESWFPHGSSDKSKWFQEAIDELSQGFRRLRGLDQFAELLLAFFGYTHWPTDDASTRKRLG